MDYELTTAVVRVRYKENNTQTAIKALLMNLKCRALLVFAVSTFIYLCSSPLYGHRAACGGPARDRVLRPAE